MAIGGHKARLRVCDWLTHKFGLQRLMAYCVIDYNQLRLGELKFTPLVRGQKNCGYKALLIEMLINKYIIIVVISLLILLLLLLLLYYYRYCYNYFDFFSTEFFLLSHFVPLNF